MYFRFFAFLFNSISVRIGQNFSRWSGADSPNRQLVNLNCPTDSRPVDKFRHRSTVRPSDSRQIQAQTIRPSDSRHRVGVDNPGADGPLFLSPLCSIRLSDFRPRAVFFLLSSSPHFPLHLRYDYFLPPHNVLAWMIPSPRPISPSSLLPTTLDHYACLCCPCPDLCRRTFGTVQSVPDTLSSAWSPPPASLVPSPLRNRPSGSRR